MPLMIDWYLFLCSICRSRVLCCNLSRVRDCTNLFRLWLQTARSIRSLSFALESRRNDPVLLPGIWRLEGTITSESNEDDKSISVRIKFHDCVILSFQVYNMEGSTSSHFGRWVESVDDDERTANSLAYFVLSYEK